MAVDQHVTEDSAECRTGVSSSRWLHLTWKKTLHAHHQRQSESSRIWDGAVSCARICLFAGILRSSEHNLVGNKQQSGQHSPSVGICRTNHRVFRSRTGGCWDTFLQVVTVLRKPPEGHQTQAKTCLNN